MSEGDSLILYVDDERANRLVFEHSFSQRFRIKTVDSGRAALEILAKEPVAVLVTDQRMPDMSGNDLLLRAKELYPDIIRIVITAYSDLDPILSAVNDGLVARYLIKPWDRAELEKILLWAVDARALGLQSSALMLRLLETERLVTLGSITSAIVHDLIQPLTHMSYNAEFFSSRVDLMEELLEALRGKGQKPKIKDVPGLVAFLEEFPSLAKELQEGIRLAIGIVTQLQAIFSRRRDDDEPKEADPLPLIRYAINVCHDVAVDVEAQFLYDGPSALPVLAISPTELAQALINLMRNAAQAFIDPPKAGGRILVSAVDAKSSVKIVVKDDGCGMSQEVLAKLGTAFYSTRPTGTGLGVMQCRRFAEKAGGKLSIESKLGQGTTVTLELPKVSPR